MNPVPHEFFGKVRLRTLDGDETAVAEVVHAFHVRDDWYVINNNPVSDLFSYADIVNAPWSKGIPTCTRQYPRDLDGEGEPVPRELVAG